MVIKCYYSKGATLTTTFSFDIQQAILNTCDSAGQRIKILENSKKLKSAGEREYNEIMIDWKLCLLGRTCTPL